MSDYISREALLGRIRGTGYADQTKSNLIFMAQSIPAADVRPVERGEWIEDEYGYKRCDRCGYEQDEPETCSPFCPNCGADMREEEAP